MISKIRLRQYRSYLDSTFELSPGLNIIIGPNASGKTNLLEAVMFICKGTSFRTTDTELIMHNKNWARLEALVNGVQRTVSLRNSNNPPKEFAIDNKPYLRINQTQQIPVVLFEPNHLLMLSGSPELRRNYLDNILDYTAADYKRNRLNYIKTLKQRNALLKTGQVRKSELFPWNIRLSHIAGLLIKERLALADSINSKINDIYHTIAKDNKTITVRYKTCVEPEGYESLLLKKLDQSLELDLLRGFSAYGPHREDLEVLTNDKLSNQATSRGEARTIVIALKTIEANTIQQTSGFSPIILLDDVFSELDSSRTKQITHLLNENQTLITTTDKDIGKIQKQANIIHTDQINSPTNPT